MVRYEFHCDSNVLELVLEDQRVRVFIDLNDLSPDGESVVTHHDPADVRNLFDFYGCAEKCPVLSRVSGNG